MQTDLFVDLDERLRDQEKTRRLQRCLHAVDCARAWRTRAIRLRQRAEVRYRAALRHLADELLR
jgi:hypothetical protein